jgi:glutamine synthetase
MTESLKGFKRDVDALIDKGEKKEVALMHVLRDYITRSKNIRFEGDNYSEEWAKEAAKRGLSNFKTTPEALDAFVTDAAKKVFFDNGIYSNRELEARHEILLEEYIKKVQIEARILGYIATNHVLPAAINYQNVLATNVKNLKELGLGDSSYKAQLNLLKVISGHIQSINDNVETMIEARKKANNTEDMHKRATMYCNNVKSHFDTIRYHADKLELMVDDKTWPLPKYRELLYLR